MPKLILTVLTVFLIGFFIGKYTTTFNNELSNSDLPNVNKSIVNKHHEVLNQKTRINALKKTNSHEKNYNKESLISKSGERISEEITGDAEELPVQITNKNNNKSNIEKAIDQPPAKETLSPYEELALLATNKEISKPFNSASSQFHHESIDDDWAYTKEQNISDYLNLNTEYGEIALENIKCKTTICELWIKGNKNYSITNILFEMNKEDWSNFTKMTTLDKPSKNEDLQLSIVILKE